MLPRRASGDRNPPRCRRRSSGGSGQATLNTASTSSSSSSSSRCVRRTRLDDGETKTLYHPTTEKGWKGIKRVGKLLRSSSGCCGGGIYFAATPEEAEQKAAGMAGVILKCHVRLGTVKRLTVPDCDTTFTSLDRDGYDSVWITGFFRSGDEWVVYNFDQVEIVAHWRTTDRED